MTMEFPAYFLVNVYTPNAKQGLERLAYRQRVWDPIFLSYVKKLQKKKPVVFCGDLNVAHKEIDIARPRENAHHAGFTPEERRGCDRIVQGGFTDTFRLKHPNEPGHYTWWSPFGRARERNIGWRIDYFFVSDSLKKQVRDAGILPQVMGSDHAPVGLSLLG
jgi:exodeoxyribonuclease-3